MHSMSGDSPVAYSPEILTEGGVLEAASTGNIITAVGEQLLVTDSISLAVVEDLGTYPKAKNIKISPCSQFVCFVSGNPTDCLTVIELETNTKEICDIDTHFRVDQLFWSPDSKFIVYSSELSVYLGVYVLGGDHFKIEGPSCDDFNLPLIGFSKNGEYFSLIKNSKLITYSTTNWDVYSRFKCILNPLGMIYIGNSVVGIWNGSGEFIVYSLIGEKLFEKKELPTSRIKGAKMCHENRILVLPTFDDKVEVYDVFSWNLLYSFEYPTKVISEMDTSVWVEPSSHFSFNLNTNFCDQFFDPTFMLTVKPVRNVCDEFKLKTIKKYLVELSVENEFLATYSPSFTQTVWIRSLKTGSLVGVVSLSDCSVQELIWHPNKATLAIVTLDSVVFWTECKVFSVYSKNIVMSFHWIQSKLPVACITTQNLGVLIYIEAD